MMLSVVCDPVTHELIQLDNEIGGDGVRREFLMNVHSGKRIPVRDGIPIFINEGAVTGQNKKYQAFYNRIAPGYDLAGNLYAFLKRQNLREMRSGYLEELDVREQDRVLEVSVGTGLNLQFLPPSIQFYGLDLSWGMLQRCVRNLRKWNRDASLFCGEAENLPFKDASFDVVFHTGGINFFNDKERAIREMIRVAKPGTKSVISDETEKLVKGMYEKSPWGKIFRNRSEPVCPSADLVPQNMQEVRLKEFRDGALYCLSFRKPA
jgi:ubiquinone/menaquinone biosynthesis C-methylase UbiE